VGVLRRDRFDYVTSLTNLGIPFKTRDVSEAADYEYTSRGDAQIQFHTAANTAAIGAVIGNANPKASVLFKRANAVLFLAKGCTTTTIDQQDRLGQQILGLYEAELWPKDHVVITELVTAGSATILVSASEGAKADFSADVAIAPQGISLADASAGLQIANSYGVATQILASRQLTPLFRASGVRRNWFSGRRFEPRAGEASEQQRQGISSPHFVDLDYADLEDLHSE
jgi:hypothetical protein